jgi:hypothetical protein
MIALAQDRDRWRALVNSLLNLQVPYNDGKLLSVQSLDWGPLEWCLAPES